MAHLQSGIRTSSMTGRELYRSHTQDMDWQEERASPQDHNVGDTEQMLSGVIGGALLFRSILRPSLTGGAGALIGLALVHRAVTGRCAFYGSLGVNTSAGGPQPLPTRRPWPGWIGNRTPGSFRSYQLQPAGT